MIEPDSYHYFEDVNWGLLRLWGNRSGLDVLDVGCGAATTSERIQRLGNRVTGIDSAPQAVATASQRLGRALQADVADVDSVLPQLGEARFDVIIFADMLEHLPWPVRVLTAYLPLLKPGGSVIVSLPNFGLWSVRLAHFFGRFEYGDTGVLDRTHLRFFTRSSARRMLSAAGLTVVRRAYNPGLVRPFVPPAKKLIARDSGGDPAALLESKPYQLYLKTAYPIETAVARLWPGMLAFQMIFEAKPR